MNLPELGVGLTWSPAFEPVIEANADLVNVLEVEPQIFWRRDLTKHELVVDQTALDAFRRQSPAKLVHSFGCPVGGTVHPGTADLALLRSAALDLAAPWVSEHLSFNRVNQGTRPWDAGFMLPPRQTSEGIDSAVSSIRFMSAEVKLPLAVETGVSYLRPRADELPDGEFVARVAEAADCGILLDLHNIWTNDRNGRQPLGNYLDQLPLERVWELHLAGVYYHRGYWLDAHSGLVPEALLELAARLAPRLSNLKAIIFELFPSHFPNVGTRAFRAQLESLHRLWDRRGHAAMTKPRTRTDLPEPDPEPSPKDWESTLASLAVHRPCDTPLAIELRRDPGLAIIRETVEKFRGSMVVRTLRLSARLIMLERGCAYLEQLLAAFWRTHPPQRFAVDEADAFAAFLKQEKPYVPYLSEVLEYDRAVIAVALDGEERSICFGADPLPLLRALGAGRRPTEIPAGEFEIRLTADQVKTEAYKLSAMELIH